MTVDSRRRCLWSFWVQTCRLVLHGFRAEPHSITTAMTGVHCSGCGNTFATVEQLGSFRPL